MAETLDLAPLVRQQLEELLADPAVRQGVLGGQAFTPEYRDMLEGLSAQVGSMLQDQSLGRTMNGPLWLSGTSVLDGTITADKLTVNSLEAVTTNTGTLNVTGDFTAAASFPATGARIVVNSSGLWGYSGAATTTFKLNTDGSGEIGTGSNKISWTTGGVVTVPAAVIGSLTIANVGGGTFGGTYQSSANSTRFEISSTALIAYASGTETFKINATTGAVTATGSFTVQSATSGARVVVSNAGGLEGYNSGGTRTFFVNAASGAGQLGAGTNNISWDSSGNASIGGVALSSGKITASHLSVSTLSAITADLGTITAGSINASTVTVSNLNATNISSGSVGSGASGINLGGTNGLGINGNLTLGSGGKIIDADGSYWDQNGIVLASSGSYGDSIRWRTSGTDRGSIYSDASGIYLTSGSTGAASDAALDLTSTRWQLRIGSSGGYRIMGGATDGGVKIQIGGSDMVTVGSGSLRFDNLSTTGTAQAWPTGGSPTSVIMSTDAGSTLLSIGAKAVTINVDGTNYKFLAVGA